MKNCCFLSFLRSSICLTDLVVLVDVTGTVEVTEVEAEMYGKHSVIQNCKYFLIQTVNLLII